MMDNGEKKKVAIKVSGRGVRNSDEWKKAFLYVHNESLFLLSHVQSISQANSTGCPLCGMRFITHIEDRINQYSWATVIEVFCSGVSMVVNDTEYTITATDDTSIVNLVHGRGRGRSGAVRSSTTDAVGTSPYILPNYERRLNSGLQAYHNSQSCAMPRPLTNDYTYRIGIELEVEFSDEDNLNEFTTTQRNWFYTERDGSLGCNGCEIITIPLLPSDAKARKVWQPLCKTLQCLGAKSWDTGRCGLHVHIGREILGETDSEKRDTLGKILYFYETYLNSSAIATKVFGRERCYHEQNIGNSEILKAVRLLGSDVLKLPAVGDNVKRSILETARNLNRYAVINLKNSNTIEFRKGRGSLSVDRIQAIVTICEACCLYCRSTEIGNLSADGFREWIRHNISPANALYHYYDVIEIDS